VRKYMLYIAAGLNDCITCINVSRDEKSCYKIVADFSHFAIPTKCPKFGLQNNVRICHIM
jgi:hypothetical protein